MHRHHNHLSILVGHSVHNQLVERTWKVMHQSVTKLFTVVLSVEAVGSNN